jgi:hypothetical protein
MTIVKGMEMHSTLSLAGGQLDAPPIDDSSHYGGRDEKEEEDDDGIVIER